MLSASLNLVFVPVSHSSSCFSHLSCISAYTPWAWRAMHELWLWLWLLGSNSYSCLCLGTRIPTCCRWPAEVAVTVISSQHVCCCVCTWRCSSTSDQCLEKSCGTPKVHRLATRWSTVDQLLLIWGRIALFVLHCTNKHVFLAISEETHINSTLLHTSDLAV